MGKGPPQSQDNPADGSATVESGQGPALGRGRGQREYPAKIIVPLVEAGQCRQQNWSQIGTATDRLAPSHSLF